MYICICNALTDRHMNEAIAAGQVTEPDHVYAACGCRKKCGKCVGRIIGLMQTQATMGGAAAA